MGVIPLKRGLSQPTIKNQLGKPTDCPKLRWIVQYFPSIHLVIFNQATGVANWTQQRDLGLTITDGIGTISY